MLADNDITSLWRRRITALIFGSVLLLCASARAQFVADEPTSYLGESDDFLTAPADDVDESTSPFSTVAFQDGSGTGATAPATSRSTASAGRNLNLGTSRSTLAQARFSRPTYMIADNTGGGCGGLFIDGNLVASILHPTFACSRLNIAENNSPLVQDRVYFSYRHFHNASEVSVFPNTPGGGTGVQNIDRFTLGFEKKIGQRMSIECRLPFNTQLSSDLFFAQLANERTILPLHDLDNELGNIALIAKLNLWERETYQISGGVAVNLPTAPDVRIRGLVNDPNFVIRDANGNDTGRRIDADLNLDGTVRNQTVNLSPFVAYVSQPTRRLFTQGFAQIDIALNESFANLDLDYQIRVGSVIFRPPPFSESDPIAQQTLLRLNWGAGYWLIDRPDAPYLNQLGMMFEVHYTTTLNDAKLLGPVEVIGGIPALGISPVNLTVGNIANRVDTLNLVAGIPTRIGMTTITHGFVIPVRDAPDRGFDFEYNLLINRNF